MVDQPILPSTNKLGHESFPQPSDPSTPVWRYLNLAKYIWLLENKRLYLSRLDQLQDPHEGSTPRLSALSRNEQLRQFGDGRGAAQIERHIRESRKTIYVNCWHLGSAESEAMWRLYCPSGSGVAIQTSYQRLVASLEHDPECFIGKVTYIDYETQGFQWAQVLNPVMHKRLSFEHEHEVRIVKWMHQYYDLPESQIPFGLNVDWLPEVTIDAVYVDPYAPDYYYDVVRAITRLITPSIEDKILWSRMRAMPNH